MVKYGNNERPFALTVDGWAGTQKYGAVWTGDQTGGTWENIGYQIPTYIGSSLSGLSNVGADIDGIYEGGKPIIQTRDLQWKSFTPIQLNMDGWGSENKTPFTFGGRYADINRFYLKLKSQLLPYMYSAAYRNTFEGIPLLKPVVYNSDLKIAKRPDLTHEFLIGDDILVAPIYKDTQVDVNGNDVRHNIYLPGKSTTWIDYFTGKEYAGNQVVNHFAAPLWKTPVFIRKGAIIPENNPNNNPSEIDQTTQYVNIYPDKKSSSTVVYDDDGVSEDYLKDDYVKTKIDSSQESGSTVINISKTKGNFEGFVPNKKTVIRLKINQAPKKVLVNGKELAASSYKFEAKHQIQTFSNDRELSNIFDGSWLTINIPIRNVKTTELKVEVVQ
ncbi:TIM-barrel domain-containing protein [Xylocopilactobacillus apis]